jgi:uncharacterized protein YciI
MKNINLLLFFLLFTSTGFSQIQVAEEGYKYFEMPYGDTTITMREYYLCFLNEGPNRGHDELEAAKIQEQHLAYLAEMYQNGYTCITGPFGDEGKSRGIVIYAVATKEKASQLANQDPAVQAGRLVVEIRPWWSMVGSTLK